MAKIKAVILDLCLLGLPDTWTVAFMSQGSFGCPVCVSVCMCVTDHSWRSDLSPYIVVASN